MQTIIIGEYEGGKRLDKFLNSYFDKAPKSFIYKMLRKKNIKLNGKKAEGSDTVKAGDEIKLFLSDDTVAAFHTETKTKINKRQHPRMTISDAGSLIYEDNNVIFFNKAVGVLSQKSKPSDESLNDVLLSYVISAGRKDTGECTVTAFTPSVCNRLDRNTSGLITFAKNYQAARLLNEMFRDRSLQKYYLAVVKGDMYEGRSINAFLKKDDRINQVTVKNEMFEGALPICTAYEPLYRYNGLTLIKVKLITGKTHQIRAHLSYIGHPIIGDSKYGIKQINDFYKTKYGIKYQMLHSYELVMPHISGSVLENLSGQVFKAAIPDNFKKVMNIIE